MKLNCVKVVEYPKKVIKLGLESTWSGGYLLILTFHV